MGEHLFASLPYCNMNVYPDIVQEGINRNAFVSDLGLVTRIFFYDTYDTVIYLHVFFQEQN